MFKHGKKWCVAALTTIALVFGTGITVSAADNASTGSDVNTTSVTSDKTDQGVQVNNVTSNKDVNGTLADESNSNDENNNINQKATSENVQTLTSYKTAASQGNGQNGWQGNSYYQNGQKVTNKVINIDNDTYSFDASGNVQRNHFMNQNGNMYYFGNDGKEYKNQFYQNWGHMYYFGNDGARYTNQFYSNWGKMYYFGDDGARWDNKFMNRWNNMYYFGNDGARYTNQFYQNWGKTYYFGDGGVRWNNKFMNRWNNTYYFGNDGARYTNQLYQNWGNSYWFGNGGVLLRNGYIFLNSQDWYAQSNGVLRTAQYFSQFTPINAPEGCSVAALAILLSTKGKYFNLGYAYNHVPQAGGVYNTGAFSGIISAQSLAWWAYQNIDNSVRNICGSSLSSIASLVASGHPVLYYGFSSYERAYGNRNHAKVIIGEGNGYFHVLDPCYWNRGQRAYTMGGNGYDTGADSWRSWGSVASEYNGSAITIY